MIDFDVSELMLYFGDDYVINDKIKIHQPTIGEISDYNEASYFSTVHTLTATSSDVKSILWDQMNNLDWTTVSNFEVFMLFSQTLTPDKTSILLGDLDLSKMRPFPNTQNGEIVLADKENGIIIDELIYTRIVTYIRKLHNIKPKNDKAKNKRTKMAMIEADRRDRELNKKTPFKSYLLPLISSVKVRQGYTKDYVRNMGLYEFFDDLERLQIIHSSDHLMSAVYAGTIDTKKNFDKKQLNWMRET